MLKRKPVDTDNKRYYTTKEMQGYTGLGRTSIEKMGKAAGARIKIGRCTRWDKEKIDQYLESLSEVQ